MDYPIYDLLTKQTDDSSLAIFSSVESLKLLSDKRITVTSVLFFSWCSCNALAAKNLEEFFFQTVKNLGVN